MQRLVATLPAWGAGTQQLDSLRPGPAFARRSRCETRGAPHAQTALASLTAKKGGLPLSPSRIDDGSIAQSIILDVVPAGGSTKTLTSSSDCSHL